MSGAHSVPNDAEYAALSTLADLATDFFVARAVRLDPSGGKHRLMLLTDRLHPMYWEYVAIDDPVMDAFFPIYDETALTHNVFEVVCVYLDPDEQAVYGCEVACLAARRLTSRLTATSLRMYLDEVF